MMPSSRSLLRLLGRPRGRLGLAVQARGAGGYLGVCLFAPVMRGDCRGPIGRRPANPGRGGRPGVLLDVEQLGGCDGGAGGEDEVAVAVDEAEGGEVADGVSDRVLFRERAGVGRERADQFLETEMSGIRLEQQPEHRVFDEQVIG
jgi:hypothetical protein